MPVLELPPLAQSVPTARHFVREAMSTGETSADVDTATLLVTEVVTNAVLYALTPMTLRVEVVPDLVRVEVSDGSTRMPRMHAYSSRAGTGRGLRLVDSLAVRWGVRPEPPHGKAVWFEVGAVAETAWELTAHD